MSDLEVRRQSIRYWLAGKHVGKAFKPSDNLPEVKEFTWRDLKTVHQYQRRLPHWEFEGSTYFISFRVTEGMGQPFEQSMQPGIGQTLASIVEESLWFGLGDRYALDAYVIMPDHVHLLLRPLAEWTLAAITKGIKGFTAREINKVLGRRGSFWQDERFDHLIRNPEDWLDKFNYIHQNPVVAGLVDKPEDYPFSSLVTMHCVGRMEDFPWPGEA